MRVIGGEARGRRLELPGQGATRPLLELARGAIFNILGSRLDGAAVLDLYAGSGALGIEALSRGAREAVFVEASAKATAVLQANLAHCDFEDRARVIVRPVAHAVGILPGAFDLIFIDPPFSHSEKIAQWTEGPAIAGAAARLLAPDGRAILRVEKTSSLPERWEGLELADERAYGRSRVGFYRIASG
jgi:16S rRNA (guanine966-N2)-methyltransferase